MSTDLDLSTVEWIRSTHSDGSGGQCVEFSPAFAGSGVVPVRDSKVPGRGALVIPADGWSAFVEAVKGGAFSR